MGLAGRPKSVYERRDSKGVKMSIKVMIPTPLRVYADKKDSVDLAGKTVGEVLKNLTSQHAELKKHLFSDDGKLRNFVNLYLNNEDVRYLQKDETKVKDGDTLTIVPSIAGGR